MSSSSWVQQFVSCSSAPHCKTLSSTSEDAQMFVLSAVQWWGQYPNKRSPMQLTLSLSKQTWRRWLTDLKSMWRTSCPDPNFDRRFPKRPPDISCRFHRGLQVIDISGLTARLSVMPWVQSTARSNKVIIQLNSNLGGRTGSECHVDRWGMKSIDLTWLGGVVSGRYCEFQLDRCSYWIKCRVWESGFLCLYATVDLLEWEIPLHWHKVLLLKMTLSVKPVQVMSERKCKL